MTRMKSMNREINIRKENINLIQKELIIMRN
nr:MAG TPA: hypothetical protein [Caudoviricetes sp.]